MRALAQALVALAVLAFVIGTYAAFAQTVVVDQHPVTYWRGAVGFLLFAIAFLMLDRERR